MIKVLLPHTQQLVWMTLGEVEQALGFQWTSHLRFHSPLVQQKVIVRSNYAIRKKELNTRERWLGVRFHPYLLEPKLLPVSIRWIDEEYGYGVFAERDIPSHAYIGEYTGFVRKRKRRADRSNDYCFEYTIGDWLRNPFIIDAQKAGNFTRFMNHSDDPNIETLSVYAKEMMHIIFLALKPIAKGEQLCYHYGDYFWKKRRDAKGLLQNAKTPSH